MSRTKNSSNQAKIPYRRIVIKLGTRLLTGGSACLNPRAMSRLIAQVARLHAEGREILLVTSGAIAAGRDKLGVSKTPGSIPIKQVLAAVGQARLMNTYERLFDKYGITVAQALLTKGDLTNRAGYLNARNTLLALLELRVIGIINENDVVAVDEIQETRFGDNDNLSAMVANLVDADLLMILSDVDGLYSADPTLNPDARLIPEVKKITPEIERLASSATDNLGTGGMATKIEAARLATASGITVVIAGGREKDAILRLASGEALGTRFAPGSGKMESRKRWMLSGLSTKGTLVIDPGAALALKQNKRSLLPAGIEKVSGEFDCGDIVDIYDNEGNRLGCGITNYCSADINIIKGADSRKIAALISADYGPDIVHRNNLVVF